MGSQRDRKWRGRARARSARTLGYMQRNKEMGKSKCQESFVIGMCVCVCIGARFVQVKCLAQTAYKCRAQFIKIPICRTKCWMQCKSCANFHSKFQPMEYWPDIAVGIKVKHLCAVHVFVSADCMSRKSFFGLFEENGSVDKFTEIREPNVR